MKTRMSFALFVTGLALALAASGCGDGVGQPIKKDSSSIDGTDSGGYCKAVAIWNEDAAREEDVALLGLNLARASGYGCGAQRTPSPRLAVATELQCSARRHARDMAERGYFAEITPEGDSIEARILRAGYRAADVAEVILRDEGQNFAALTTVLSEGGPDCEELLDSRYAAVGVGKFGGLWAVDLGSLREP